MGLIDDLAAPPAPTRVYCGVARTLDTLDSATADALRVALADPVKWSAAQLARTLDANGVHVNDQAISRHRRGDCRCP